MNFGVIILITVVILLLYYLYVTYIQVNSTSNKKYDLNTSNSPVTYDSLKNKTSTRYSYSLWIYVNSWSNRNTKSIITRGSDFNLSLDANNPVLSFTLESDSVISPATEKKTIITQNFPLQKWTYVIISVDNQIIDVYIDGKLLMSKKITYLPKVSTNDIRIGDDYRSDIFLTSVTHTAAPMDPETAWNNYTRGNGLNNDYNVNLRLSVLQDNIEQGKVSLF